MPRLLREQAGKWYHRFACQVLTIEVYNAANKLIKRCPRCFRSFSEKAQEMKAIAEQGLNMAKDKCKVQ